jgi:hypothetical protein
MIVDTTFNVYSDARGGDPDSTSPTLRLFHKILWSKPLPNGRLFQLSDNHSGAYLHHNSELGEFFLGSDAITHSYKNHKRKFGITKQIPSDVNELFDAGSTIGAYILFPNNRVDGQNTINQARGVNSLIDDRFDLTLECIRRFYLKQQSPLYDTLARYDRFFDLFVDFDGYFKFFLLDDLVDESQNIKFYLPFDDFKNVPAFVDVDEYLKYKRCVIDFIRSRNNRIKVVINQEYNTKNA